MKEFIEMQSKELIALSNKLIVVQDQLEKALVELEDMNRQYKPLRKAFEELVEETLEYRERLRYNDEENWRYDQYDKANLL